MNHEKSKKNNIHFSLYGKIIKEKIREVILMKCYAKVLISQSYILIYNIDNQLS